MSEASEVFTSALREAIVPALRERGYTFDGRRTFRRILEAPHLVQIVNFQLGQSSSIGKFTVNLSVYVPGDNSPLPDNLVPQKVLEYHCTGNRRQRLGKLVPRQSKGLFGLPFFGKKDLPQDMWWHFSSDRALTMDSLRTSLELLLAHGLPWLEGIAQVAISKAVRPR